MTWILIFLHIDCSIGINNRDLEGGDGQGGAEAELAKIIGGGGANPRNFAKKGIIL